MLLTRHCVCVCLGCVCSIYLESPGGVGFSYTLDGNYTTGDNQVAADNLVFMEGFFAECTSVGDRAVVWVMSHLSGV